MLKPSSDSQQRRSFTVIALVAVAPERGKAQVLYRRDYDLHGSSLLTTRSVYCSAEKREDARYEKPQRRHRCKGRPSRSCCERRHQHQQDPDDKADCTPSCAHVHAHASTPLAALEPAARSSSPARYACAAARISLVVMPCMYEGIRNGATCSWPPGRNWYTVAQRPLVLPLKTSSVSRSRRTTARSPSYEMLPACSMQLCSRKGGYRQVLSA
ncbi:hypothetical protein Bpfe_031080 [Biomphalaria pfeifferi]|uniref:Uncharacterized protein n=1 Tax=Biomphalaria pfeifferi TaxID=112525 RepID=A0AAD8ANP1_BIOPF|nr:hypothetical protein Bpfe_031080 [Biomphalaria pfeifferi]